MLILDIECVGALLETFLLIKNALNVICIIAPILLIISILLNVVSTVTSSDVNLNKLGKKILSKVVSCIIIFYVPTIVNFTMDLLGGMNISKLSCWSEATKENVKLKLEQEKKQAEEKENDINNSLNNEKDEDIKNADNTDLISNNDLSKLCPLGDEAKTYNKVHVIKTIKKSDLKNKIKVKGEKDMDAAQAMSVVGDYIIANQSPSGSHLNTLISVIDKESGKRVNKFVQNLGHAPGMTFNTKENKLYISHGNGTGKLHYFSVDNIQNVSSVKKKTKKVKQNVPGIAYDYIKDRYYAASGMNIYVYDNNFKLLKKYHRIRNHVNQDIAYYRGIILDAFYQVGQPRNAIDFYRASDGKYIGTYNLSIPNVEIEGLDYAGNDHEFFLLFNLYGLTDEIYKLNIDFDDFAPPSSACVKENNTQKPNNNTQKPNSNTQKPNVETNKTPKILFVGNSKTYREGQKDQRISVIFERLSKSGGYNPTVTRATKSGARLEELANVRKKEIQSKAFDIAIIQDHTYNIEASSNKNYMNGAKKVVNMIKSKNKDTKIYLRSTWGLKKNLNTDVQKRMYKNSETVASSIGAIIINDGKAFDASLKKYPKLNVFSDDRHQSKEGAYLSACCIYKRVYGKSPVGLDYYGSLSSSVAKNMQKIADETC